MRRIILVYLGGGLGAALRALLLAALAGWDRALPLSVLVVNLVGACALGVVYILADEAGLLRAETRLFLAVGVLGGFTTFSTFAWGADSLIGGRAPAAALAYVGASVLGGILAVGLGLVAAREAAGLVERAAVSARQRMSAHGQRRHGKVPVDAPRDVARSETDDQAGNASDDAEQSA